MGGEDGHERLWPPLIEYYDKNTYANEERQHRMDSKTSKRSKAGTATEFLQGNATMSDEEMQSADDGDDIAVQQPKAPPVGKHKGSQRQTSPVRGHPRPYRYGVWKGRLQDLRGHPRPYRLGVSWAVKN